MHDPCVHFSHRMWTTLLWSYWFRSILVAGWIHSHQFFQVPSLLGLEVHSVFILQTFASLLFCFCHPLLWFSSKKRTRGEEKLTFILFFPFSLRRKKLEGEKVGGATGTIVPLERCVCCLSKKKFAHLPRQLYIKKAGNRKLQYCFLLTQ